MENETESSSSQTSEYPETSGFSIINAEDVKGSTEDQEPSSMETSMVNITAEGKFDDSEKIKFPDPEMEVGNENPEPSVEAECFTGNSMIEGAWADILGSGHLKKKVLRKGKPDSRPIHGQTCVIRLKGKLASGEQVDSHERLEMQLGDHEVIKGLDLAIPLMDVGEISQIEVSPRFAYGSLGRAPDVPPDATILYEVELIEVVEERDMESYTLQERLTVGNTKRERGNWWYSRGEYSSAVICYRRALDFLDTENETETDSPERLQEVLDDRLKVYNNMAVAQMKLEAYDAALKSVDNVLRCQPDNVKAIYRKSKILTLTSKTDEAIALLERALHLDPSNKVVQQDLARLQAKKKADAQKERSLYQKMLGVKANPLPAVLPDPKSRTKLSVPWTLLAGAVTAVIASYATYRYKLF